VFMVFPSLRRISPLDRNKGNKMKKQARGLFGSDISSEEEVKKLEVK
jgi:hypothetical protein